MRLLPAFGAGAYAGRDKGAAPEKDLYTLD